MILTTKNYDIRTAKDNFSLHVSRHSDNSCFACIIYLNKSGKADFKMFANSNEEEVFEEASNWFKQNYDLHAEIVERKE